MDPHLYRADPHRPPAFAPLRATWRIVFALVAAASSLGFFGAVALWTTAIAMSPDRPDDRLMGIGALALFGTILLVYVQAFVGMAWLYKAWSWLPWEQRYSAHWKGWISPSQAALFLLIPYFQYYWMFVVNPALCDAFDRLRVRYPTREAAPKTLAIVASAVQMVFPIPVGAICWFVFMSKIEAMSREMSAAATTRGHLAF